MTVINKVCTKLVETLEGNHYNGFKAILITSCAISFVAILMDKY
jgi:uncharacterized membrane protein YvlD (DUF360 family)